MKWCQNCKLNVQPILKSHPTLQLATETCPRCESTRLVTRVRPKKPCERCKGEGWFTTNSGTVMCSDCRGKGHK